MYLRPKFAFDYEQILENAVKKCHSSLLKIVTPMTFGDNLGYPLECHVLFEWSLRNYFNCQNSSDILKLLLIWNCLAFQKLNDQEFRVKFVIVDSRCRIRFFFTVFEPFCQVEREEFN